MKKFILFSVTLFLMLSVIISTAISASSREGRRKFRYYCYKQCHYTGVNDTIMITPSTYTTMQWSYYFQNDMKILKDEHPNKELQKVDISGDEFQSIQMYLKKHALDSDRPETCGG